MPKAWGPCQRHGDDAKGMVTMPKAKTGFGLKPQMAPNNGSQDFADSLVSFPETDAFPVLEPKTH